MTPDQIAAAGNLVQQTDNIKLVLVLLAFFVACLTYIVVLMLRQRNDKKLESEMTALQGQIAYTEYNLRQLTERVDDVLNEQLKQTLMLLAIVKDKDDASHSSH